MELTTAINGRRSIRKYRGDVKITKEQVDEILKAALMAPSWKNSETGRYHVVMGDDMVNEVREYCLPPYNAGNTKDAPVLIVATVSKGVSGFAPDGSPVDELGDGWGMYDLGLQNQNLMLKAYEMGFGTLVMGLRDVDRIREKLDISENEIIVSVISLGAPDIEPNAPKRKELSEVVKYYA